MNKFQIISLIMRAICVIYFLIISYWAIFVGEKLIRAGLWWSVNILIILSIGYMSLIFWDRK